jgi:hypothetical protein
LISLADCSHRAGGGLLSAIGASPSLSVSTQNSASFNSKSYLDRSPPWACSEAGRSRMSEIRTSGSMSGERRRSDGSPGNSKPTRLSSNLPYCGAPRVGLRPPWRLKRSCLHEIPPMDGRPDVRCRRSSDRTFTILIAQTTDEPRLPESLLLIVPPGDDLYDESRAVQVLGVEQSNAATAGSVVSLGEPM